MGRLKVVAKMVIRTGKKREAANPRQHLTVVVQHETIPSRNRPRRFIHLRVLAIALGVFLVGCRPMPPIGETESNGAAARPRRSREFREVKYTDKTPEEWRQLLGHHNAQVRDQAIDALLHYGPEQIPHLVKIAEDSARPTARLAAMRALGAFGPKADVAIPVLLAALKDTSWDGRDVAAEALGFIGQSRPEVVQGLSRALKDSDERVRMAAARALGRCHAEDLSAVQALMDALDDPDPSVQLAAVEALGELGPVAAPAVSQLEQLARSSPPVLQATVQQAIKRIASKP